MCTRRRLPLRGDGAGRITFNINNPEQPIPLGNVQVGSPVRDMVIAGFVLYAATNNGLAIVGLDDPANPAPPLGANQIPVVGLPANGVVVSEGHVFVANGNEGIHEIDVRVPAQPIDLGEITPPDVIAIDVIVSQMPGQKWVIGPTNGDISASARRHEETKRCYPDSSLCLLELEMYDRHEPARSELDPNNSIFDLAVDSSANPFFRQVTSSTRAAAGSLARRSSRRSARCSDELPRLVHARLRCDVAGVMQALRSVQTCGIAGVASANLWADGWLCVGARASRCRREREGQSRLQLEPGRGSAESSASSRRTQTADRHVPTSPFRRRRRRSSVSRRVRNGS
jgi:hypothetical protein